MRIVLASSDLRLAFFSRAFAVWSNLHKPRGITRDIDCAAGRMAERLIRAAYEVQCRSGTPQ